MAQKVFKEKQGGQEWEVYAFLTILSVLVLSAIGNLLWSAPHVATAGNLGFLLICLMLIAGAAMYFRQCTMVTSITHKGVRYKRKPWQVKKTKLSFNDISSFTTIDAPRCASYSGWNISYAAARVQCVGVPSRTGIELHLRDGQSVLINSRDPKRFAQVLRAAGLLELS